MRLLPAGPSALLLELADLAEARAHHDALARAVAGDRLPGVVDLVPAARTVLVAFDPRTATAKGVASGIRAVTASAGRAGASRTAARTHEIPVVYDGEDLAEVAELLGTSTDEVVERHTGSRWEVAFGGFAPGFAYLMTDDPVRLPRRSTPRTAVPAGSVALADTWCGIYPRRSPGGWQVVGRTDAPLWDIERRPPALLAAGDVVRFVAVDALPQPSIPPVEAKPAERTGADHLDRSVEVLETGPLACLQDLGRPGHAAVGLGRAGAADQAAHALALRLTGCRPDAATIELTLGGLVARAHDDLLIAVTGAQGLLEVDGRPEATASVVRWPRGTTLRVGAPTVGLRAYLAVAGGWEREPVLGSRSWDTLSGTGPAPLRPGDVVAAGSATQRRGLVVDLAVNGPAGAGRLAADPVVLEVEPGPRADWFTDDAWDALLGATWQAGSELDRVGVRLDGPALGLAVHDELPSEGMVRGAVQVSRDGRPTIFLADHPVTGGYPVIAVLTEESCDRASQLVPGRRVVLRRA